MNRWPPRIAEQQDAEAIAALINLAFRVESFFIEGERTNPDRVRYLLQTGRFLLVEAEGRLLASVYLELQGKHGYLGLLAVDPAHQRQGLGARLVAAAEDYCRAAGCLVMDLQIVNIREELPLFYRQLGYIETGDAPFPDDANPKIPCHFVKMSKPLA
jgi:GNAT superfamily N-acetyltransferase